MKTLVIMSLLLAFVFAGIDNAAESNLVGWWKLDETSGTTAHDSAGSNNGTLQDNPVWTTGLIGGALQFDGSGDYINVPDNPSLRFTNTDNSNNKFTICCFVRPVASGYLVSKWRASGTNYFGYALCWESAISRFKFTISLNLPGMMVYTFDNSAPAGTWHHVTATYEYSTLKIYLDGILHNQNRIFDMGFQSAPDKDLTIGARSYDNIVDNYFAGTIDDVRIYNRALSAEEISILYYTLTAKKAHGPNPATGQQNVDPNTILAWAPGYNTVSHNVYLGTSFADVNSATVPLATTDVNSYDPCGLDLGQTYYWRIDEYDGSATYKGDIWSFAVVTEQPTLATNPNPANGATNVGWTTWPAWTAGTGATSHDVYFGISNPPPFIRNQTGTTFDHAIADKAGLYCNTTYYWRIDEKGPLATTTGTVWSFTVQNCTYTGSHSTDWNNVQKPACWCKLGYPRQCHGDADGHTESFKTPFWVGPQDLNILLAAWQKTYTQIAGRTIGTFNAPLICADITQTEESTKTHYRVGPSDLSILLTNWMHANLPATDCP